MRLVGASDAGISIAVEVPAGVLGRSRGLLGRSHLDPGTGMLLRTRHVHTIGMRFPIDAVFLSGNDEVLRVVTMHPGRIGPLVARARWVLELGAGEAQRMGIRAGGRLERKP